jgi:hypothetical protein
MTAMAWIGAIGGGTAGAFLWGAIAHLTGLDVGYIAWGLGLLVGVVSKLCGGKGKQQGMACAMVSIAAILGGKGLATATSLQKALKEQLPAFYQERIRDAQAYRADATDTEVAKFMLEHAFSDRKEVEDITPQEVEEFRQTSGSMLETFAQKIPELSEWLNSPEAQEIKESASSFKSVASWTKKSLGALDWIFGGLGVATAYQVVANQGDDGSDDDEEEDDGDTSDGDDAE